MQYKILLGCPIGGNREWILPYYLNRISKLQFDKKSIILYFITNNIVDNSLKILEKFKNENKNDYADIIIEKYKGKVFKDERTQNIRESETYNLLVCLRNKYFQKVIELDCTHLLSIDSDILIKPTLLNDLLSTNSPITASLIWNGYTYFPSRPYNYTNILRYENGKYVHIANWHTKNPDKTSKGKVIPIDATGACCLISREVCENTYYKWHVQGEDLGWADICREKGYKMICLPHCFSQHVMSEELLQKFKDFQ